MSIKLTAFKWVPPFAQGLVRDLRVRWALEEAGLSYTEHLIGQEEQSSKEYREKQPFGQVPVYEEDGLVLFETGAILLHIAERSEALMPGDANGRARARAWVFAALNSVEPPVQNLVVIDLFCANEEWAKLRRPGVVDFMNNRLKSLSTWMEGREYLEESFSAGDLMMVTVLRLLRHTDILSKQHPLLEAHRLRCEARPAFKKALAAQMAPFARNAPP
ncbi:glutathione S-transferase [Panacagrimonas perspica]|uniref:Glutathione S-transferase n=1 Tax=Panacagrimonas perspica TaxID=381431 RepID=A0A4V3URH1_9GAMM|nr:glutathione S-transferase family protein [Panacagrimonas perspica]TDU25759.1 glutathione S-transferase [Panacagrimonas perspica]THD02861.1 glutathione S-transferase [Panacagrimonas perspica]